ncbi:MAG: bifunctional metallophosphatase/5'-nucleotidase [Spirochaetes bacterium]|uniref:Bifunctional metallophosphatase/5'-nucleotidase n=1 Tax=Candidatus Ornithospirochaeta stercoripullorum TaxID=2840899 RepID=A0A9D9H2K4_9SPIO|nr:bifunctional metallophosphatase/5'-nucleotidase [Candidatus Ornithospirochaeta stercoripullorum]
MVKGMRKLATLAILFVFTITSVFASDALPFEGKTVILHTNDVHGSIAGYANLAELRNEYEAQGADVILVDAGDFSQGTTYVSTSKGADAVTMMNITGYDVATLGNHEFDYGYAQLKDNLSKAEFQVICADAFDESGNTIYPASTIITTDDDLDIGFVGFETPEAQTKANPALIKGLHFAAGDELYTIAQENIDELEAEGADLIIAISHLGVDAESAPNRSTDLWANTTGFDFIIDGHSHTVMTEGENGEPIQSTGTAFANIGVIVIDNETKTIEDNFLQSVSHDEDGTTVYDIPNDVQVSGYAQEIMDRVNGEYNIVFAQSLVDLNGERDPGNRTEETNLGSLIADAIMWTVLKDEGSLTVDNAHALAIVNGGGIRASISAGSVTKKDINTVLPFGNTITVVYVTGTELLEALEASTYCTPTAIGGFPQVSGIEFTVDTTKPYDANAETYPASTYYGPASINRVTINNVNGEPFDINATYAVITNDFMAAGGDTYYAFASSTNKFDTGIPLDEAVMAYVTDQLSGVIGEEYAQPFGRIHIVK